MNEAQSRFSQSKFHVIKLIKLSKISALQMETNLFSFKLFSMSTDNIKQLKSFLVSTMESNLQPIQQKLSEALPKQTDLKHISKSHISDTIAFMSECYIQKQQQVDNLANFILQFLSSLQDVFQELDFKDKKINDLKKTLIDQSDFIIGLQDEIQQYKDKLNNAEDYIHWMEEQMQYFDLLCLPSLKPQKYNSLSKCKSQKTLNSSQLFFENETSQRRKKIDYERLKFYIETLKEQKNHLIREYNNLVDEHERKLFECEKHSILLDQLFEKFKTQSAFQQLSRVTLRRQRNPQNADFLKKCFSHKNLTNPSDSPSDNDVSINISGHPNDNQIHSFNHITEQLSMRAYADPIRHCLRQEYDESFTEGNSVLQSFISDTYYKHNLKIDVGVNTKKTYCVSTSCQTSALAETAVKPQESEPKRKAFIPKMKLSKKSTFEDSGTQSQNIQCEISINLKNVSNQDIKNIDFSRLINREILEQTNHTKGYSLCHRQKKKGSKHLCQHLYCFMTNKVVTERIKKYKYAKKQ